MHQIFDAVRRAQDAALAAARPGVPLASIDAAARKVIADAGFGPGTSTSPTASATASAWTATSGPTS